MLEQKINNIIDKYLDVKLYEIAEYKGLWTIIVWDIFDKGQNFISDCEAIINELEEFAQDSISMYCLEDDQDKFVIEFQEKSA